MTRSRLLAFFLGIVIVCGAVSPTEVRADPTKEILLTSTYGVIAGSIVGLATLAFVSSPGDHLRNIALGASIGLYAGIGLGIYIAYGLPEDGQKKDEKETPLDEEKGLLEQKKEDGLLPKEPPKDSPDIPKGKEDTRLHPFVLGPQLAMSPTFDTAGKVDGFAVYSQLLTVKF
jgi:hypothetical protein